LLGCGEVDERVVCSNENIIQSNMITGSERGILVEGPNAENQIIDNTLEENEDGLIINHALETDISSNRICDNTDNDLVCQNIFVGGEFTDNQCQNIERDDCNIDIDCDHCRELEEREEEEIEEQEEELEEERVLMSYASCKVRDCPEEPSVCSIQCEERGRPAHAMCSCDGNSMAPGTAFCWCS